MKNFDFIKKLEEEIPAFHQLHAYCDKAEIFQKAFPEDSATNARKALEWLVKNHLAMAKVTLEPHETLSQMLKRPEIDAFVNEDWELIQDMRTVKKIGNYAAHTGTQKIRKNDAFICLRALYHVACGFLYRWQAIREIAAFDATLIPQDFTQVHAADNSEPAVSPNLKHHVPHDAIEHPKPPTQQPAESLESEAITRQCLIDYMLNEAGWEILHAKGDIQGGKAGIEIKIEGMDRKFHSSGIGYADYVLFSKDSKPLAVIEAKSTIYSPETGRKQAIEYADCLEKKYGVRPVIYYTNGYTTKVIDGLDYPPRNVISFHSYNDLEYLIQKRSRSPITNLAIDDEITNRPYQKTAIKSLVEWLNRKHRRGLLVLATGTGKTRVSISLCKLLYNNSKWLKNVLFLADRKELVKQAHERFEEFLPSQPMSCLSEDDKPDTNARIVFSTYQTMINYINTEPLEFSIGHFDLIIIDEAHRSVFGKYGAIFQYFDSLLIGLTATPRAEIDKNTFQLLELENEPNFEYTYEEAIRDEYLRPYRLKKCNSKMINRGIKYDDLSAEQREQLEKVWEYEKAMKGIPKEKEYHRDIQGNEIFNYLINDDTIDNVLSELMTNGLKVHSGEDVGKTIIFAYNHKHAERIVERFNQLYPERGADYCQLIDNQVKNHSAIIADFKMEAKMPQIAVSVDMLDTGIDVPEILNLVFFKIIKSKIKFEQMIGRGTRLCKDLFGPGEDKQEFYIFDWCGNFDFFSKQGDEEAKRFDIVMLHIMLSLIDTTRRVGQFRKVVVNIAAILEKKASIPAVMERIDIIRKVQKPVFWENESLDALEHVRRELRGLVHLLKEQRGGKKFIIDIEDTYTKVEGVEDEVIKTSYKQRVIDYLAENSNNDTLRKIQHFEQLTSADIEELERIFFEELGTKDEYNELTEGHPYKNNVAAFIRVINGIDRKKALQIYQQFIEGYNLTSEQELYLKNILDYISMNGDIETRNFLEYPLKDLKWRETFGDTFVNLKDFIKQMHRVIIA